MCHRNCYKILLWIQCSLCMDLKSLRFRLWDLVAIYNKNQYCRVDLDICPRHIFVVVRMEEHIFLPLHLLDLCTSRYNTIMVVHMQDHMEYSLGNQQDRSTLRLHKYMVRCILDLILVVHTENTLHRYNKDLVRGTMPHIRDRLYNHHCHHRYNCRHIHYSQEHMCKSDQDYNHLR